MIELDLNPNFDARVYQVHRNRNLSDIIRSCEKALSAKARSVPGSSSDISECESLVSTFLCTYVGLEELLDVKEVFRNDRHKDYLKLIRLYSVYAASKAVLNLLNDDAVKRIREHSVAQDYGLLAYGDIDKGSDYTLIESVMEKLKMVSQGTTSSGFRYNLFVFFDRLREMSKSYIRVNCSSETIKTLNNLKICRTGLEFAEIPPPQKKEFSKENDKVADAGANVENLPSELPVYTPQRFAALDKVIGNIKAKEALHAALIRVLKYDARRKANPFYPFRDAFLVHGEPGVGKNFTIDALLNYVKETSAKFGEDVEFVDLSQGIKSMYRDRSAQIFERYVSIENEGAKVYVNIIDEADGVFTINERGEMCEESKKLLREMKKAINNSDRGNAVYIFMSNYADKFEAALKQRFTLLKMEGPSSEEDFARLVVQELGASANGLSREQFYALGEQIFRYKKEFMRTPSAADLASLSSALPITGRDVKKIVSPFVSGDDARIIANEPLIRAASYDQITALIPRLGEEASYEALCYAIKSHMLSLLEGKQ